MGEAKRRGTFEHRKAEGIKRREAEEIAREEERHRFLIAHNPSKNAVALAAILIAARTVK